MKLLRYTINDISHTNEVFGHFISGEQDNIIKVTVHNMVLVLILQRGHVSFGFLCSIFQTEFVYRIPVLSLL